MNEMTPYFIAAITSLGACIVTLWKIVRSQDKKNTLERDACVKERAEDRKLLLHTLRCLVAGDFKGIEWDIKHMERQESERPRKPPSDKPMEVTH